jgi:hypothetical protein
MRGRIETTGCGLGFKAVSTLILSVQSSWTCGGPARERVPGHGMPADDGSAAKFAIHAMLFVSDVDCLSWFSVVPCAVRELRKVHAVY